MPHMRALLYLLLISWVISLYTLFPFPQNDLQYLDDNRSTLREIVLTENNAKGQQLTEAELANEVDKQLVKEKTRVWGRWSTRASVVLLGIACVSLLLRRFRRQLLWCVVLILLASLGIWIWPYLTTGNSVSESFSRFGSAVFGSKSSRLMAEFILFNVLIPIVQTLGLFLLLVMMARSDRNKPNG